MIPFLALFLNLAVMSGMALGEVLDECLKPCQLLGQCSDVIAMWTSADRRMREDKANKANFHAIKAIWTPLQVTPGNERFFPQQCPSCLSLLSFEHACTERGMTLVCRGMRRLRSGDDEECGHNILYEPPADVEQVCIDRSYGAWSLQKIFK
jgi:hypothetical protein